MNCVFCNSVNPDNVVFCASCGMKIGQALAVPPLLPPLPPSLPDWETHGHLFNVFSFIISLREVLFSPAETFRRLKADASIFNALLFGLIGGSVGGLAGSFWQYLMGLFFPSFMGGAFASFSTFAGHGRFIATLLMVPFATAIGLFLSSAVFHLCLSILGGAKKDYAVTFKVYAYAQGSTAMLGIIPVFGSLVGWVWSVIVTIIGLKEAHGTTTGKSSAAVLLPLFLCCAFVGAAAALLVMVLMTAGVSTFLPWLK